MEQNEKTLLAEQERNMEQEVTILLAEDDEGHAILIKKNLKRAGINNQIIRFKDGQEVLNFLFNKNSENIHREKNAAYLLLLDIRMPKVDGIEVLRQLKADKELCKIPVTMLTTTDDPREIEHCHALGCSNYIAKPLEYDKFTEAVQQLGFFMKVVKVPQINGSS
jgi:CheY-like chemotaxis protein